MKTTQLKALTLSVILAMSALPVNVQSATWMEDFFNSAGAAMNVSPADVYHTQNQTVLSLGGFSYRAPQRAFQPFSFSPPGYKAGCGGIDVYLGAYGFANKSQFIAALRNIGQNAVGYFFKLALKTMAPEIDAAIEDISKIVNQLNQFQIGSCETMRKFVGEKNIPDTRGMALQDRASTFASAITGSYGDYFGAHEDMKVDSNKVDQAIDNVCKSASTSALCMDSNNQLVLKRDSNIVYDALNRTGGYTSEEMEYYMSLLGTVVFTKPANVTQYSQGVVATYYKPTVDWIEFVGNPKVSSTIKVRQCKVNDCLVMSDDNSTASISFKGYSKIVADALQKIRTAIDTRVALTDPTAMQVIAITNVPIYHLIADSMASGHGDTVLTDLVIDRYSEVIANEIAFQHLTYIYREVNDAINTYKASTVLGDVKALEDAQKNMSVIAEKANNSFNQKQANARELGQNITLMLSLQKEMFNSLGKNLMANLEFQKNHQ